MSHFHLTQYRKRVARFLPGYGWPVARMALLFGAMVHFNRVTAEAFERSPKPEYDACAAGIADDFDAMLEQRE